MTVRRSITAGVAGLVAVALTACGADESEPDNPGGARISPVEEGEFKGAEPATPYQMPNVSLPATTEASFNLRTDTEGRVTLVFFGYTHCPDVCQLVMSDLTAAYLRLEEDVREETQLLFITSDPARDDLPTLTSYLDRYDPSFIGVTGKLDTIASVAKSMGVPIEHGPKLPSGGYEVGHGVQVVGFRDDQAPVLWTQGTSVAHLVEDITELAEGGS